MWTQPALGQDAFTFKSAVSNVRIDAQVMNRGQVVTDLTQQDFVVFDNNLPQPILYFGHDAEPLSLLLLIDVSGSMQRYVDQVASVARQALRALRKGDTVAIMIFSRTTLVKKDFTDNLNEAADALRGAVYEDQLGSGTAINDALMDAATYMQSHEKNGRRAVVILTDNLGLNYKQPDAAVIEALYGADTVLNALVVGKGQRPAPITPGHYTNPDFTPPDVFAISDETGGEAIKADRVAAEFPGLIQRIRTRYSLQYHLPESASGFRKVRVELTPQAHLRYPEAEIRARRGYTVNRSLSQK